MDKDTVRKADFQKKKKREHISHSLQQQCRNPENNKMHKSTKSF